MKKLSYIISGLVLLGFVGLAMATMAGITVGDSIAAVMDALDDERGKEVTLTSEQRILSEMLSLEPKLFPKRYTKYGPIITKTETVGNFVVDTFFYAANDRGTIHPIGDRRTSFDSSDAIVHQSWRTIKGSGDNPNLWKDYKPTLGINRRTPFGAGVQEFSSSLVPKPSVRVFLFSSPSLTDAEVVIALSRGVQAMRGGTTATPDVRSQLRKALASDEKEQEACPADTYVLENFSRSGDRTEFDLVSILGSTPALDKYGLNGARRLTRYHISPEGIVTRVTLDPVVASYTIADLPRCGV